MLERDAQERDRKAREAGENPAASGWTDNPNAQGDPAQPIAQGGSQTRPEPMLGDADQGT
jgi:hypothetical protein